MHNDVGVGMPRTSAEKAIVARLSSVEELAGMTILSDKTGTLTLNKMMLQDYLPTFVPDVTREEVLKNGRFGRKMVGAAEGRVGYFGVELESIAIMLDPYEHTDYVPFDPIIKRTEATVKNETTGEKFVVTKGAPHVLLEMSVNKDKIGKDVEEKVLELAHRGIRSLAVRTKNGDITERKFKFIGILTFLDPLVQIRNTPSIVQMTLVSAVKMITGDHRAIAVETCRTLGGNECFRCREASFAHRARTRSVDDVGQRLRGNVPPSGWFRPSLRNTNISSLGQCANKVTWLA